MMGWAELYSFLRPCFTTVGNLLFYASYCLVFQKDDIPVSFDLNNNDDFLSLLFS
jgi:hypothetical protein